MMDYFNVGERVIFLPVPLSDPDRVGKGMDALILFDMVSLAKQQPVKKHIVHEAVRIRRVEPTPSKVWKIFPEETVWAKVNHVRKTPLYGVMMCFQAIRGPADPTDMISRKELLSRSLKQEGIAAFVMGRYVHADRKSLLFYVKTYDPFGLSNK